MFPPKVSISFIILLNNGRPGTLADCFSTISAEISIFSRTAYSRNSVSCASILKTCLSSTSVDLRAYKKNFCDDKFCIICILKIKNLNDHPWCPPQDCSKWNQKWALKKTNFRGGKIRIAKNFF